jgi:hypothetical protein
MFDILLEVRGCSGKDAKEYCSRSWDMLEIFYLFLMVLLISDVRALYCRNFQLVSILSLITRCRNCAEVLAKVLLSWYSLRWSFWRRRIMSHYEVQRSEQ